MEMTTVPTLTTRIILATLAVVVALAAQTGAQSSTSPVSDEVVAGCEALRDVASLTITSARVVDSDTAGSYCYVRGILPPAIGFHVQLPLPDAWNGRFLKWGDGGKDGDLDFADHRVAEGYAVANSNTGHDNGAEPGSSFGWNNRQAEIDFGYRAVHLTTRAGKTLTRAYYGRDPEYSYFEGCSTGGRQGLMEAQRFPEDFDGIVAGAPANHYQHMNAVRVWLLQRMFRDDFAGALAYDTDGDGRFDSVNKIELLATAVLEACDAEDGVDDGVIDDPSRCDFDPARDLAELRCPNDEDADDCFTVGPDPDRARLPRRPDRSGRPGRSTPASRSAPSGSGPRCSSPIPATGFAPGAVRPRRRPSQLSLLRRRPRGDPTRSPRHLSHRRPRPPPARVGVVGLRHRRRHRRQGRRHERDHRRRRPRPVALPGRPGRQAPPLPRVGRRARRAPADRGLLRGRRRDDVRRRPREDPRQHASLHGARDGTLPRRIRPRHLGPPGPARRLGRARHAPDRIIATHQTDGRVDNERPLCPYPQRAVYTGPGGESYDPQNWIAANFSCR